LAVFQNTWRKTLEERSRAGLIRHHKVLESAQGVDIQVDGRSYLAFCSNDYLGLANHPDVSEAAIKSIESYGVGSGASHLVIGHHLEHELLEKDLADFTSRDRAMVFSSGYMANMALVSSLVDKSDLVLQDKLNHASLLDGGLLSGARFQRFLHNDMNSLEGYLSKFTQDQKINKTLVVTDGVFSMDGDIAHIDKMARISKHYDALLMVDDAHGLGVLGEAGAGTLSSLNLSQDDVPVLMGTFGKAFGTSGAFVAGSEQLIEFLTQVARPYIYTTAMPPAVAAATRKSLELIKSADASRLHLKALITYFREKVSALGYLLMPSDTPIQPVLIGSSFRTMALAEFLKEQGVLVGAIRPPTVPDKTARLRITLSAAHSFAQIDRLLDVLDDALQKGVIGHD
jgi:8-amino-7-oxononanoate synthase